MPESISTILNAKKNTLHLSDPWAWLVELDSDGTNGFFVTSHDASLSFGGKLYVPFPLEVGTLSRDSEGNLPDLEVKVGNAGREIGARVDAGQIIDRVLHLRLVNSADLTTSVDWGEWTVQSISLVLPHAVLVCGPYNLFEAPLPAVRQFRSRCAYVDYGGLECQYDKTLPNGIAGSYPSFDPATCDFGLETPNGCRVHGHNEAANLRPRLHPGRFGGLPGIPKGPARV